jgi:hypothetical protein
MKPAGKQAIINFKENKRSSRRGKTSEPTAASTVNSIYS